MAAMQRPHRRRQLLVVLLWTTARALVPLPVTHSRRTALRSERGGSGYSSPDYPDTSQYDGLIEEFLKLKAYELPGKVKSEEMLRTIAQPSFFVRIAELCDMALSDVRKERLRALADNLTTTLNAVVSHTVDKMETASEILSEIVATAAEADGEFLMPLSEEKLKDLKAAVDDRVERFQFDETLLQSIHSCMKKATEDQLTGVVELLQKILQLYAAKILAFNPDRVAAQQQAAMQEINDLLPVLPDSTLDIIGLNATAVTEQANTSLLHPNYASAVNLYTDLMALDAKEWDPLLKASVVASSDDDVPDGMVKKANLMAVVQAQIEQVVLLQENGSFAQRVQAEFLRELIQRIELMAPSDKSQNPFGEQIPLTP